VVRGTLPFVGCVFLLIVLITFVPEIVTWLPSRLY
jgi:TRAP-type C4-dicarboxylate transport system permease large subunit